MCVLRYSLGIDCPNSNGTGNYAVSYLEGKVGITGLCISEGSQALCFMSPERRGTCSLSPMSSTLAEAKEHCGLQERREEGVNSNLNHTNSCA